MKHIAPIVPGPLEFDSLTNELIFIQVDEDSDISLLGKALSGKLMLIFSPTIEPCLDSEDFRNAFIIQVDSVYKIFNYLKTPMIDVDFIVVDRLDMLDINLSPKERGCQIAAFISMMAAPKNLRGANLIVSSSFQEQNIKKKSSRFLNLKTNNN